MPNTQIPLIHPLLGPDDAWSGYCVEFASDQPSLDALNGLINSPLLQSFDLRHPWLIPAIPGCVIKTALGERAVNIFSAQPAGENAETLAELEAALRQSRCQVGLTASPNEKLPSTGAWNYLLINCSHARSLPPYTLLGLSSRTTVIATDLQSNNDREWAQANTCALTTTEFIQARPTNGKKADMTRVKLLELLALIVADADTSTLEAVFRQEPKLSYSLLRLVNSAAISPRSPITSFAQAINLLGRRQLQRWLQLLVYADPNDGQRPNPLLQKAAARGRQMELLVTKLKPRPEIDDLEDAAFMIGTFSLLDVLLNMPIKEILEHLPLSETVSNALAEYAGGLGQLLAAISAAESRDLPLAVKRIERLAITGEDYQDAQLSALSWAASIRPAS